MAFNINAQVILSGPKNIQKVRSSISKQLSGVNVDVNLKVPKNAAADLGKLNTRLNTLNATLSSLNKNAKTAKTALDSLAKSGKSLGNFSKNISTQNQKAGKSFDDVGKSAAKAGSQIEEFGKDAALAVRRFSAFTIATGAVFGLVRAVQTATSEAIKFERELARIVQVTGASDKQVKALTGTIDQLSTSLGIDANKLSSVSVTFAQTGQSIDQVAKSLKAVSRASLAPTFGEIEKTTEGVIAALAQFKLEAGRAESVLGSLNAVSKSFAVESDDLISVIRRAGGVFAASSVQLGAPEERLRELIGIFTAVRSTTRESADTIATGLRTIFTRVQRPQTIKFLEQFGVQLRATAADAKALGITEGEFVGIFEALKRISAEIGGLDTLQLAKVVEELGGVRQVGKLLPALREFEKAERARAVALAGTESISKDVAIATQTLSVQIENLQQKFGKLIRDISQSQTFQTLAKVIITTADSLLTLASALQPVIPLLTAFAGIKLTGAAFKFSKGFVGGLKKGGGTESVGAAIGDLATGGGQAGKQNAKARQASDKQVISALNKNVLSIDKNTQALTALNTGLGNLNTTQNVLVKSANNLSAQSTQLIAALNKLPAVLLRGTGGGATPLPIRRRRRADGGIIPKFAKGGFVDGPSHAQGGVIAELEGGEFVVSKKDAKRQGLQRGGTTRGKRPDRTAKSVKPAKAKSGRLKQLSQFKSNNINGLNGSATFAVEGSENTNRQFSNKIGKTPGKDLYEKLFPSAVSEINSLGGFSKIPSFKVSGESKTLLFKDSQGEIKKNFGAVFDKAARESITSAIENIYDSNLIENIGIPNTPLNLKDGKEFSLEGIFEGAVPTLVGYLAEGLISAVSNISAAGGQAPLDLPRITSKQSKKLQKLFGSEAAGVRLGEVKKRSEDQADLAGKLVAARNDGNKSAKFTRSGLAVGGKIGLQNGGMVPVAISNGEGLVDAATASQIMPLLERARAGDGAAIQALAGQRNIIDDIVGPGTGTSDSIKTNLAAGSFVLQKSIMDRIDGQRQNAATGGRISRQSLRFGGLGKVAKGAGSRLAQDPLAAFFGLQTATLALSSGFEDLKSTVSSLALAALYSGGGLQGLGNILGKTNKAVKTGAAVPVSQLPRAQSIGDAARFAPGSIKGKATKIPTAAKLTGIRKLIAKPPKGSIIAILGAILADPIIDFGVKQTVGKTSEIGGFSGFTKQQGGTTTANIVGGAKGAVGGGLTGAAIGGVAGPVGSAIGAAVGAFVGGVVGGLKAAVEQIKFESLTKLNQSGNNLAKALDKLAGEGIKNAEALKNASKKLEDFSAQTQSSINVVGTDFSSKVTGLSEINTIIQDIKNSSDVFEAFGKIQTASLSNFDTGFEQFQRGGAANRIAGGTQVLGNIAQNPLLGIRAIAQGQAGVEQRKAERQRGASQVATQREAAAIDRTLGVIDPEVIKNAEVQSARISKLLLDAVPADKLSLISNLGADATFNDLAKELENAGSTSKEFKKQIEAVKQAQAVGIIGRRQQLGAGLDTAAAASVDPEQAKLFFDIGKTAANEFSNAFIKSGSVEKAAKAADADLKGTLDSLASNAKLDEIFAGGLDQLKKDVKDVGFGEIGSKAIAADLRIVKFAQSIGVSDTELKQLITQFSNFEESASDGGAEAAKAAAKQRELEIALRNAARGIDAFAAALDRLEGGVSDAVGNFGITLSNVNQNVGQILSSDQTLSGVARGNVFTQTGASRTDLQAGVERIRGAVGGSQGQFADLADTVRLGDQIPTALKKIVDDLEKKGGDINLEDFQRQLEASLPNFSNLSDVLKNQIRENARSAFEGTRQGGLAGVDEIERLLSEGGLAKFSELSGKAAEALGKVTENLNKFESQILEAANLRVKTTQELVSSQLSLVKIQNESQDTIAKFTNVSVDRRAQARQRVQREIGILTSAGGAGDTADLRNIGGRDTVQGLLERRAGLESIIADLKESIGQRTAASADVGESIAGQDTGEIVNLQKRLADATSALTGTKKSIDLLATDTRELTEVQNSLVDVNSARLSGRQRQQLALSRIGSAKNVFDQQKIIAEITRPLSAFIKAQAGQKLTDTEGAALLGGLAEGPSGQIGNLLRQQGITNPEEINKILEKFTAVVSKGAAERLIPISPTRQIGEAAFGGLATTEKGTSAQEIRDVADLKGLSQRREAAIQGTANLNQVLLQEQQFILQNELSVTKDKLLETAKAFEALRSSLPSFGVLQKIPAPAASVPTLQAPAAPPRTGIGSNRVTTPQPFPPTTAGGGLSSAADQKFARDIEVAATTLSTLPELQVSVNGNVGPVEVVLNGTQLLTEFKETFLNEVRNEIAGAILGERTDLV